MSHDVAVMVDDEDRASAHAVILQAVENGVEGNDGRQHACEIIVCVLQWHSDDERRTIVGSKGQGIAAEFHGLHATAESALQGLGHERITFRAEISLRSAGTLTIAAHRGQIDECVAIGIDEIFEQAGNFWLGYGIFDVFNQTSEGQDLALADELLGQVCFKELHFLGERAG